MRILNRIVTFTKKGVLYEADPRHHELMLRNLGLGDAKGCVTPGVKPTSIVDEAPKEGAPEPWDDSVWQNSEDHVSALLEDWQKYEAAKIAALDELFKSRDSTPIDVAMDVDYDASADVQMPDRIEPETVERPEKWADVVDDCRLVRFREPAEVMMVPNFEQTWLRAPRTFVLGKKGQIISIGRQHDPFTGVLKTEVKERRRKMMATQRWTRKSPQRRAMLDVMASPLSSIGLTSVAAAITRRSDLSKFSRVLSC